MLDSQLSTGEAQALTNFPHTAGELLEANRQHLQRLVPFAEHWFCWGKRHPNKAGEFKVPIDPKTGKAGSASDPATAGTFERATAQCVSGYGYGRGGGVGVMVTTAAAGFVGLDFDDVRDPESGDLNDMGAEVVRRFAGNYVEISPSDKGLRVFCLGSIGASKTTIHGGSVEVYPGGEKRFLRVTGAVVTGCAGEVVDGQAGLDWLAGLVAAAKGEAKVVYPTNGGNVGGVVGSVAGGEAANDPSNGGDVVAVSGAVGGEVAAVTTSASIRAKVEAMSVADVEEALFKAWNPKADETRDPAVVVESLRNGAQKGRPLGQRLAKLREGKEDSEDDQFLCCAAVRRGALTVDDVAAVLVKLAGPGGREKVTQRKDYRTRTAESALRAVLLEVLEHRAGMKAADGKSFMGWAFLMEGVGDAGNASTWKLSGGLADALNKSGDRLATDKNGRPLAHDGNVVVILRNDPEVSHLMAFNELHQQAMRLDSWSVFDRNAAAQPGIVESDDAMRVCMWLSNKHGIRMRGLDTMRCIEAASRHLRVNPLADRLDELAAGWDGVERVDSWLTRWAGADDSGCREYIKAAGRCFMVSAVARALQPGCKVDTVLTLEGETGGGKSTLFRVLSDAVLPGLFTDSVGDASSETSVVRATSGKWIAELPELAAVRKAADVEALKASLSRSADNYKAPYAILARDYERQFVFVATTNKSQYISDTDGALLRRFMPVRTTGSESAMLDLEGLKREAGQLWGEAVRMYRAGVKWRIDAADGAAFTQWVAVRSGRKEDGVFHDEVVTWLAGTLKDEPYNRYTLKCIAGKVGHTKAEQGDKLAELQLADTLRSVGMVKRKSGGVNLWQLSADGAQKLTRLIGEGQAEARAEEARQQAEIHTLNDKWAA